jgi:transcriptional regulator with XRE-family HTH domain
MTLAEYLATRRKKDFAEKLGTSPSYLSQLLSGHRKPGRKMMLKIQESTDGAVDFNSWSPSSAPSSEAS